MEKLERKFKKVSIKWKEYVEVKERILALVDSWLPYAIHTEHWYYPERKMWVVKATLTMVDSMESFTWLAQELEDDSTSMVNKTSALENAETSAVGRACAFAWIWVIDSIASADEVHKAINRSKTIETPKWSTKDVWFNDSDYDNWVDSGMDTSLEAWEQYMIDYWFTRASLFMKEKIKKHLNA